MNMNKRWKTTLGLGSLMGLILIRGSAQAASTADATITVTPVATVDLTLSTNTYAFGNQGLGLSTHSATSLNLSNAGQVSMTVDKRILTQSSPAGWTAGATAGADAYVLWATVSSTRPTVSDFALSAGNRFGAEAAVSNVTNPSGTQSIISVGGAANVWFRLDMPTSISSQAGRTITVRFTGAAQ